MLERLKKITVGFATLGGAVTFAAFLADRFYAYGLDRYVSSHTILAILAICFSVVFAYFAQKSYLLIRAYLGIPDFFNTVSLSVSFIQVDLMNYLESGDPHSPPNLNPNLKEICGHICTYFHRLTGCPCAACTKMLVGKQDGEPHVRTLVRDSQSHTERLNVDNNLRSYPYTKNTAFNYIISRSTAYCFFHCNDLAALEKNGHYHNENRNWREYYNATVVVPIAATDNPNLEDATGFLCVDNKCGRFAKRVAPRMLSAIAKQLYAVLALNDQVLSAQSARNRQPRTGGQRGTQAS